MNAEDPLALNDDADAYLRPTRMTRRRNESCAGRVGDADDIRTIALLCRDNAEPPLRGEVPEHAGGH